MQITWKLRMAAAQREVWTGAQLQRLLAEKAGLELSSASVSALFTKQPSQIRPSTLIALCTALECAPDDLFDIDTTPVAQPLSPRTSTRSATAAVNDMPATRRGRSMPPI
jgi:DNA-binding Xre family transcriptional regulator